jgi:phage baseplate assembly protein W
MATRDVRKIEPLMGRDLRLDYRQSGGFFEDADLATVQSRRSSRRERDLATIGGLANLEQAIANRLKTRQGELAALGHPGYGSRHHELIGQPNVERTRDLIKIYVLQALRDEPRIERVMAATVRAEHSPPRDTVRIELKLKVIGEQTPLNLVVPFSLEVMA